MRSRILLAAGVATLFMLLPVGVASAGPYTTTSVSQASAASPFASCDISGDLIPGEVNWVNSELEPWVAVNPTDPSNIIGVYQQDRYAFGGARGLAASVSHDGGLTWNVSHVLPGRHRVLHQSFTDLHRRRLADG